MLLRTAGVEGSGGPGQSAFGRVEGSSGPGQSALGRVEGSSGLPQSALGRVEQPCAVRFQSPGPCLLELGTTYSLTGNIQGGFYGPATAPASEAGGTFALVGQQNKTLPFPVMVGGFVAGR